MHTPRTWFAVIRPGDTTPLMYPSRPHAEAVATAKQFDMPGIGPWTVVELVEVAPVAELMEAAQIFVGFEPLPQNRADDPCVITVSSGELRRLRSAQQALAA